jgi:hypothetical protein
MIFYDFVSSLVSDLGFEKQDSGATGYLYKKEE